MKTLLPLRIWARGVALLLIVALTLACGWPAWAVEVDVLLRGGVLYDGTGSEPTTGDVAIRGGEIVAVGRVDVDAAGRSIDCTDMVIAPGFIDLHTHCDGGITRRTKRLNLNYLTQGCTTVVTGNCGGGPIRVGAFLDRIDRQGAGTNVAHLVPHGSVRRAVMGSANRAPNADELERMKDLVDAGMREGAWGMSTGLIYVPGTYARTDELIELAKVVASHGGIYASHIRDEADGLLESVREVIQIGRSANLPVHISHFKVVGKPNWGLVRQAAALVEEARRSGLKVTADQYPYIATSTSLTDTLLPAVEVPGGRNDLAKRMKEDPDLDRTVRELVARRLARSARVAIAASKNFPQMAGKGLREIAAERNVDPVDLALEIHDGGGASVVNFSLAEDDVRYVMALPWVATASDGGTWLPNPNVCPHPRNFGTFPRKIGRYTRVENVISLAHAIRSATGLPADILGLADRGYLRPGYCADVVVFDPAELIDRATFQEPQQYSSGVRYLFVAGQLAIQDGGPTGALAGRALRLKRAQDE
jgi:N-acyl-D-amino-acid deacylase